MAVTAVMAATALMDILDMTVVNAAVPTIRSRPHAGALRLGVGVTADPLTTHHAGGVGPIGHRRVFLGGVAASGAASLATRLCRSRPISSPVGWSLAPPPQTCCGGPGRLPGAPGRASAAVRPGHLQGVGRSRGP